MFNIDRAKNILKDYYTLPKINKIVGIYDNYNKGKVCCIEFIGELTIVWVKYKTKTVRYKTV